MEMLGMEVDDILSELINIGEEGILPPGFRFHPTDEELITYYLASKVFNGSFCGVHIAEVDLNRCEPWELPELAKMGEREWYFFSSRDRKYPTGLRTNRATEAGYWKATGKDREVYSASSTRALLGMKKTLVFYKGRAPRGVKTKWVMHEYRLDGEFSYHQASNKEEWVICRIFHKAGEEKTSFSHAPQSYPSTSFPVATSICYTLPPLLEIPTHNHQNPFIMEDHNQESSDIKTIISPPFFSQPKLLKEYGVEQSFSPPITEYSSSSPSILLTSLLSSHQDFTVLKQYNTEMSNCSNIQLLPSDDADQLNYWIHKINNSQNQYPNPSFFEMISCSNLQETSSSSSTVVVDEDITTSTIYKWHG